MKRLLLLVISLLSIQVQAFTPYRNQQPAQNITFIELKKAAPVSLTTQTVPIESDALCDFDGNLVINDALTIDSSHGIAVNNSANVSISSGFVGVLSSGTITNFSTDPNLSTTANSTSVVDRTVINAVNVTINGALNVQGHLVINGNLTVNGNVANYITIAAGGSLEVRGNFVSNGAFAYNIVNNGTWTTTGTMSFFGNKGTTAVLNTGSIQAVSSISFDKNTGTAGYAINNSGTVKASAIFACSNFGTLGSITGITAITNTKGSMTIDDTVTITSTNDITKTTSGTAIVYDNAVVCISAHGSVTNFVDTKNVTISENLTGDEVLIDTDRLIINGKLIINGRLVVTGDLVVNGTVADYIEIGAGGELEVQGTIFFNGDGLYNVVTAGTITAQNGNILLLDNFSNTDYAVHNTGAMTATEIIACGNVGVPEGVGGVGGTFNGSTTVTNVKGTLTITDTITIDASNNITGMNGTTMLSTGGYACINASGTITDISDPVPNNLVKNQNVGSNRVVIDAEKLILNGKLSIQGGTLVVAGDLEINGNIADYLEITSGLLDVRGTITCNGANAYNVVNNGVILATGDITFEGNKGADAIYSNNTIQTTGSLFIFNNEGIAGYAFNNDGGTVTAATITACGNIGTLGAFNNVTPTNIKGDLTLTDVITVDNNNIMGQNQAITLTDFACINASGTITLFATHPNLTKNPDTGTGRVVIDAATTTVNAKIIVRNNSHLALSGDLTLNGNIDDYLQVESGSTLTVYGGLILNGSHMYNVINNGTINVIGDIDFVANVGDDGVKNNAGATITADSDIIFNDNVGTAGYAGNNLGTLTAGGSIEGCANTGTIAEFNNITITNVKGVVTITDLLAVDGSNNIFGASGSATVVSSNVACLNASGTVTNISDDSGKLAITANTGSGKVIIDAAFFTINGRLALASGAHLVVKGNLNVNGTTGNYFNIQSGATLEVQGNLEFDGNSQYAAVNEGTIIVTGNIAMNNNHSTSTYAITNNGTITATGEVNACGNTGAGTPGANATADISGLNNISGSHGTNLTNQKGTLTINDTLTISSNSISGTNGAVTLSAGGHACLNASGSITDITSVADFDQLAMTGSNRVVFDAQELVVNGGLTITSSNVVINGNLTMNGAVSNYFTLDSDSTLEVRGNITCDGASMHNIRIDGTLTSTGAIVLSNNMLSGGFAVDIDGDITANGNITMNNNAGLRGVFSLGDIISNTGNILISNNTGTGGLSRGVFLNPTVAMTGTNITISGNTGSTGAFTSGMLNATNNVALSNNSGTAGIGFVNTGQITATNEITAQSNSGTSGQDGFVNSASGTMTAGEKITFRQNSGTTGVNVDGTLTVGTAVVDKEICFIDNVGTTGYGVDGTGSTISHTPTITACGNYGDFGSVTGITVTNTKGTITFNENLTIDSNNLTGQNQTIGLTDFACITAGGTIAGITITTNLEQVANTGTSRVVIDANEVVINGRLTLQNSSELIIVNDLTINGDINNYLQIDSSSRVKVYGNLVLNGQHMYSLENSGLINARSNIDIIANVGPDGFKNNAGATIASDGNILFDDNIGTSGYAINNAGTIVAVGDIEGCANTGTLGDYFGITVGNVKGIVTITDMITIDGSNNISGAVGSATVVSSNEACLNASGTITNISDGGGLLALSANTGSGRVVIDATDFTIEGKLILQSGAYLVVNGNLIVNGTIADYLDIASGATLEVRGNFNFNGASQYNAKNLGSITATGNIGFDDNYSASTYAFDNQGTVAAMGEVNACGNLGAGTPGVNATADISGLNNISGSHGVNITNVKGTLTINDTLTIDASHNVSGTGSGSASLSAMGHACLNASGTIANVPTVTNFDQNAATGSNQVVFDADTLIINGKLNITGGTVVVNGDLQINGTVAEYVNIASGATLEVRGDIICNGAGMYGVKQYGTLTGTGTLTVSNANASPGVDIRGDITIDGNIFMNNNASTSSAVSVQGATVQSITGDIIMNNNVGSGSISRGVLFSVGSSAQALNMTFDGNQGARAVYFAADSITVSNNMTISNNTATFNTAFQNESTVTVGNELIIEKNGGSNALQSGVLNAFSGSLVVGEKIIFNQNSGTTGVRNLGTLTVGTAVVDKEICFIDNTGTAGYGVDGTSGTISHTPTITSCGNYGDSGSVTGITVTNTKGTITFNENLTIDSNNLTGQNQAIGLTDFACITAGGTVAGIATTANLEQIANTGTGRVVIDASNVIINGRLTLQNNTNFTIVNDLIINGDINNYLQIDSSSRLKVYGNLVLNGQHMYSLENSGLISVNGNIDIIGNVGNDGVKNNVGAAIASNNNILFDDNIGTSGYAINNAGVIVAVGDIEGCANTGTLGDYFGITVGNVKGIVTITDTITIDGSNNISGAVGSATVVSSNEACLNASGTITNISDGGGLLALSANTGSGRVVIDATDFTVEGKLILQSGAYLVVNGNLIVNGTITDYLDIASGATLEVRGNFNFNGASQYNAKNLGSITATGNIGFDDNYSASTYAFDNQGTVAAMGEVNACGNLGAGTPGVNETADISGLNNISGSHGTNITNVKGTLTINDTLTIDASHNVSGTGSGSASLSAMGHACLNASGTITNVPTVTNFDQNAATGSNQVVFDADTLIINGKLNITGGTVVVNGDLQINGTVAEYVNIASGATLEVRGNITCDGAGMYNIIHNGTLTGTGTLIMNNNFGNAASSIDGVDIRGDITTSGDIILNNNQGYFAVNIVESTIHCSGNITIDNNIGTTTSSRGVLISVDTTVNCVDLSISGNTGHTGVILANLSTSINASGNVVFSNNIATAVTGFNCDVNLSAGGSITIEGNQGVAGASGFNNFVSMTASGPIIVRNNTSTSGSAVFNSGTIESTGSTVLFDNNNTSTICVENSGIIEGATTVTYLNNTGGTIGVDHSGGTTTAGTNVIFDTNSGSINGFVDDAGSTITANGGAGIIYFCNTTGTSNGTFNPAVTVGCP